MAVIVVKRTTHVITPALVTDEHIPTIRPRTMDVVLMAGLTTKDSCQAAYQDMGEITFHARS
jgi:hypothetical protein